MGIELWLAFVAASSILLIIPGPTVLLVISYALGHGRRTAAWTVPGVALGDLSAMVLSIGGLGALLAASAELFLVIKWAGAAYLVWLGISMWRSTGSVDLRAVSDRFDGRKMFWNSFAITTLNPKGIVFFVAFLPQFIDPAGAAMPQLILLGSTFLVLATINAALFAVIAGSANEALSQPRHMRIANRVGGSMLIGAAALMAGYNRVH